MRWSGRRSKVGRPGYFRAARQKKGGDKLSPPSLLSASFSLALTAVLLVPVVPPVLYLVPALLTDSQELIVALSVLEDSMPGQEIMQPLATLDRLRHNHYACTLRWFSNAWQLPVRHIQRSFIYERVGSKISKELDDVYKLGHEIEVMPYLFPDPSADDFLTYTFKIHMAKVSGGFKPSCIETIKYMLTNLSYAGAVIYKGSIITWDSDRAIVDKELALWAYHKLTGCDVEGNLLEGVERRSLRSDSAQAVLKYILRDPAGPLYVTRADQPEYIRQSLIKDRNPNSKLLRDITFAIRAHLIDDIFLERIKALAIADEHMTETIEQSILSLEEQHLEETVSIEDQLVNVRLEIKKTLAFLHDEILTLTPKEKTNYNKTLAGLRDQEQALIEAQEQADQTDLKKDFQELADLLADIPGQLDGGTMERKQKLARLITESVTIEEISVHWLRFTVLWRGPLANRLDVCLIWRRTQRRLDSR